MMPSKCPGIHTLLEIAFRDSVYYRPIMYTSRLIILTVNNICTVPDWIQTNLPQMLLQTKKSRKT